VGEQILVPAGGIWPGRILQARLASQLVRDSQPLSRSETGDAPGPVGLLCLARQMPVARHERLNAARDHACILAVRGESPAAVDRRCIPPGCVVHRSNTAGILPLLALPDERITGLGATLDFHHGLLAVRWRIRAQVWWVRPRSGAKRLPLALDPLHERLETRVAMEPLEKRVELCEKWMIDEPLIYGGCQPIQREVVLLCQRA